MCTKILVSVALTVAMVLAAASSAAGTAAADARDRHTPTTSTQSMPLASLPDGNEASAFAFDPRRPSVVYVASRDARGGVYVFKSSDSGQHWRSTGARGPGWRSDILSLTADPLHSGTLYAGTDTAVYKTVNGGRSWKPFREGLFPHQHNRYYGTPGKPNWNRNNGWVLNVAVDPIHRSVVYAAAGAVRKSTNGGHRWKAVLQPNWRWSGVTRIAIAPTRPESIYAIAHKTGNGATRIYKSTDAGRTWQVTGGASRLPPSCCGDSQDALAVDAGDPEKLYSAVGDTVFTTTNGGADWRPTANGLPANDVTSLAASPRESGTVYASAMVNLNRVDPTAAYPPAGAIYKTTNGGRTWSTLFTSIGVGQIAIDPARPSTIYATGWAPADKTSDHKMRLLRSTDDGRTWAISP